MALLTTNLQMPSRTVIYLPASEGHEGGGHTCFRGQAPPERKSSYCMMLDLLVSENPQKASLKI